MPKQVTRMFETSNSWSCHLCSQKKLIVISLLYCPGKKKLAYKHVISIPYCHLVLYLTLWLSISEIPADCVIHKNVKGTNKASHRLTHEYSFFIKSADSTVYLCRSNDAMETQDDWRVVSLPSWAAYGKFKCSSLFTCFEGGRGDGVEYWRDVLLAPVLRNQYLAFSRGVELMQILSFSYWYLVL